MADMTEAKQDGHSRRWVGYMLAALVTALGALACWTLPQVLEPTPYLAFYPAVVAAAAFGGMGPGLLAVVVSALCVEMVFDATPGTIEWTNPVAMGQLAIFLVGGTGVSLMAHMQRTALTREQRRHEELRESERRFRTMADAMPQLAWIAHSDGYIHWYNRRWHEYTGTTPQQMEGWGWHSVHDPRMLPKVLGQWQASILSGEPFEMEFPLRGADGIFRPFLTRAQPFKDAQGRIVQWFGTSTDVGELKRVEEALLNSRQMLQNVLDHFPGVVFWKDRNSVFLGCNKAFAHAAGLDDPDALIDKTDYDLPWAHFEADAYRADDRAVMDGGVPKLGIIETQVQADGSVVWFETNKLPLLDAAGNVIGVFGTANDITVRKRAQERLAKLNACWLAFGPDADQNINRLVALCGEMLGATCALYSRLEGGHLCALGQWNVPADFLAIDLPEGHICYDVIRDGRDEVVCIRDLPATAYARSDPNVGRYGLQTYCGKAVQVGGAMIGSLCVVYTQDRVLDEQEQALLSMTVSAIKVEEERKRAQQALAAAKSAAEEASRAKDHFIAVLSHELRNPLNPVLATVSMLQKDRRFDADTSEQLEVIRRNAELEARLIDDLLDITRIERGKIVLDRHSVELGTVIRRAVEVSKPDIEARKLDFSIDMGSAPYWVDADTARLQQVFWNLIKNAVKFTPPGGCVVIRCRDDADAHVIVEVKDSGKGIESDMLPRLFNAFEQGERQTTRQFGGLGLGLAISKTLVDLHGGTLVASSEGADKGATFTVRLPLVPAGAVGPEPPESPISPRPVIVGSLRILLVEDHGDTVKIMKRLLAAHGHQVQTAGDVATALKLADEQTFDLLLSDLGLPDGSGVDLMRAIRRHGSKLPGIALSGYGQESDIQESRDAGFTAHLTKPVDVCCLERTIDSVVQESKSLNPDQ